METNSLVLTFDGNAKLIVVKSCIRIASTYPHDRQPTLCASNPWNGLLKLSFGNFSIILEWSELGCCINTSNPWPVPAVRYAQDLVASFSRPLVKFWKNSCASCCSWYHEDALDENCKTWGTLEVWYDRVWLLRFFRRDCRAFAGEGFCPMVFMSKFDDIATRCLGIHVTEAKA